jgi:poly-D-alanine transfer protein DltD
MTTFNYNVTSSKTTFWKGEWEEKSHCWEYETFQEAHDKYEKLVTEHSVHVGTLTHVKVDQEIKMCFKTQIQYRVRISN